MATIYYDNDARLDFVRARKVAIIGYGSQGHAHALNLRDSGVDVKVGLPATSGSRARAEADLLRVVPVAEAARWGDIVMLLTPDTSQAAIYERDIAPGLVAGKPTRTLTPLSLRFNACACPCEP